MTDWPRFVWKLLRGARFGEGGDGGSDGSAAAGAAGGQGGGDPGSDPGTVGAPTGGDAAPTPSGDPTATPSGTAVDATAASAPIGNAPGAVGSGAAAAGLGAGGAPTAGAPSAGGDTTGIMGLDTGQGQTTGAGLPGGPPGAPGSMGGFAGAGGVGGAPSGLTGGTSLDPGIGAFDPNSNVFGPPTVFAPVNTDPATPTGGPANQTAAQLDTTATNMAAVLGAADPTQSLSDVGKGMAAAELAATQPITPTQVATVPGDQAPPLGTGTTGTPALPAPPAPPTDTGFPHEPGSTPPPLGPMPMGPGSPGWPGQGTTPDIPSTPGIDLGNLTIDWGQPPPPPDTGAGLGGVSGDTIRLLSPGAGAGSLSQLLSQAFPGEPGGIELPGGSVVYPNGITLSADQIAGLQQQQDALLQQWAGVIPMTDPRWPQVQELVIRQIWGPVIG